MKKLISLVMASCVVASVAFATGCDVFGKDKHTHAWGAFMLAKNATCIEDGILERICETCGEKEYQTLKSKGHLYNVDGFCTVCQMDQSKDPNAAPEILPEGKTLGWSLQDIYNVYKTMRGTLSYEKFITTFFKEGNSLCEMYTGTLGGLYFTIEGESADSEKFEFPVVVPYEKIDFSVKNPSNIILNQIYFDNQKTIVLRFADGTEYRLGKVSEMVSVGVNKQNQLLFLKNDGTVLVAGKISEGKVPTSVAPLVYRKNDSGDSYSVVGLLDSSTASVEIPITHRGLPVTEIAPNAFLDELNLKKVTIGENVTKIGALAFANTSLETIVIPASVQILDGFIFKDCSLLQAIFCEAESVPGGSYFWAYKNYEEKYRCLMKSEWNYNTDGVPTIR